MKEACTITCLFLIMMLCTCFIVLLCPQPASATAISTYDSSGKPIHIEEKIEQAPEKYLSYMEQCLRQGKLDEIGYLSDRLSTIKKEDPRVPALSSIFQASQENMDAAKQKLQEARLLGETHYILYAEAMILRLKKKYSQARTRCEKAIELDRTHPYPWNILGRIQFDQGDKEKAYTSFKKAIDLEPEFLPGHINLGAVASSLEKNEASIAHFKRAIDIDQRASNAHFGLGLVYSKTGQHALAARQFETTLDLDPDNLSALQKLGPAQIQAEQFQEAFETGQKMENRGLRVGKLIMGNAALHLGNTELAIKHLKKAAKDQPKAQTFLGFCYMVQNQYETALSQITSALQKNPNDFAAFLASPAVKLMLSQKIDLNTGLSTGWGEALDKAVYFSRGSVLASRGKWQDAFDNWKKSEGLIQGYSISGIKPETLTTGMTAKECPHLNLGVLYFYKNLYDPAIAQFNLALERNENSILSNYWAAQVMLKKRERLKAINYLNKAIEQAPHFFTALYSLAELNLLTGSLDKSEQYYKKALKVKSDPGILLKLGVFYENIDRMEEAETYYQKLIHQAPDLYLGYNQLAWLYAKRGTKLEEALNLAQKANNLLPGNASILDTLGWIYYHKKDYEQALKYLKQSHSANPQNPTIAYHIGLTYYKLGEKTRAHSYLKDALQINENFEGAEKAKKILENRM